MKKGGSCGGRLCRLAYWELRVAETMLLGKKLPYRHFILDCILDYV